VPDFPFGTDQLGRDLYSQILWAVRPTLLLVTIAAVVRLLAGIIMGLASGWASGRVAQVLDVILSSALATPVLVVALAVVAAISVEGNLQAFIIGLSLTGWAETARIIREQTHNIKGQLYIEAAHSMGAGSFQILVRHVLRQVMSMVWMLFSFEIGSTLLVTASLGFLGYYIGGEAFVVITDTTAERVASMPELGQMLATSWSSLTKPWGLFATGMAVLFMVLGFNLTAEGLSRRLAAQLEGRNTLFGTLIERISNWVEGTISYPLGRWWQERAPRKAFAWVGVVLLVAAISSYAWVTLTSKPALASIENLITVPGGHQWGNARHDPVGSFFTNVLGPQEEPVVLWRFDIPGVFFGGPVVDADGTLYTVTGGGTVYALNPEDGGILWEAQLDEGIFPAGPPALGLNGEVYITDGQAGLTAFSADGEKLWYFTPEFANAAQAGPVVGWDGTIYYATAGAVQAVSPNGEGLWFGIAKPNLQRAYPKVDPSGQYVFIDDVALRTEDGQRETLTPVANAVASDSTRFSRDFLEADPIGNLYLQTRNLAVQWSHVDDEFILGDRVEWDQALTVLGEATQQGYTPDQVFWQLFTSFGSIQDTTLHWIDSQGHVISSVQFVHRPAVIMGIDGTYTMYTCGVNPNLDFQVECAAWPRGETLPLWRYLLDPVDVNRFVNGGALVEGRFYVSTLLFQAGNAHDGVLFALGSPTSP
jgi:peptide/nickel transport system permease protein